MPIIGLFHRENSEDVHVRLHRSILDAMRIQATQTGATITEQLNYTLAARYCPDLIAQMDTFKKTSRYSFPTRKTGNRYTK